MVQPTIPGRNREPKDNGLSTGPAGHLPALARNMVPSEEELRRVAIGRLKKRREFRSHLFVYIVINTAFWVGWLIDGLVNEWQFPWPVFPTVVWGLFILGHASDLYWKDPLREDLVQAEIRKLRAASVIHPLDIYELDDDEFR